MRIAFVGKGGSGKSTLTASFASYLAKHTTRPVAVFDADINIHIPELLGFAPLPVEKHLSHRAVTQSIQEWLIGDNAITALGAFRKTTPPSSKSNIIQLEALSETPLAEYGWQADNVSVFAVGTYQETDIGASCYHNNLAIFESILNHTDDLGGYVVADMVAGVDAFSGTLHAQFDMICLIVEPTRRSLEVYDKYLTLATEAGVQDSLLVIGNKVRSESDKEFIARHITSEKVLGYFVEDEHIRWIDQMAETFDVEKLHPQNISLLNSIKETLDALPDSRNKRLAKLWELHKKYVGQAFITERFGDLTSQIDTTFSYRQVET